MAKPRIFLGSSGKQVKLLQALTRGLQEVAQVEPWTTSLTPGTSTLDRLVDLAHDVDFAAFVVARDDWTTSAGPAASQPAGTGQDSPGTTWCSRRACLAAPSACGVPSSDHRQRAELIAERLGCWKAFTNASPAVEVSP